eukprot:Colp12_sorted_trinity150504_noHs@36552
MALSNVEYKTIYFTVEGRPEQVEFSTSDNVEDIKGAFHAAAESDFNAILKLRNSKGNIVAINKNLTANTPDSRYTLEVVAANSYNDGLSVKHLGELIEPLFGSNVEERLKVLESTFRMEGCLLQENDEYQQIKSKLENVLSKVKEAEYLSWIGLHRRQPNRIEKLSTLKYDVDNEIKYTRFRSFGKNHITEEIRSILRTPSFDIWQWEDEEMMYFIFFMFSDLGLVEAFKIETEVLQNFIIRIHQNYNNNAFHNFRHCFCVTQMMYGIIHMTKIFEKVPIVDIFILLVSAICHDLDHPGMNNAYQINARTPLAIRYNDVSPLENHHCSVAFLILSEPSANICRNMDNATFMQVRQGMIACILATDMANHGRILNEFKAIMDRLDFNDRDHRIMLYKLLIKCSDISNEARPTDVSEPWVDCLLEEFFNQSDLEKAEGLPVAPFMDREKVSKPSAQVGFIGFVMIPLFDLVTTTFPDLREPLFVPVKNAHQYYVDMVKELEAKKKAEAAKA